MENKSPVTLRVYDSIIKSFNDLVDETHRGAKGTSFNSALLMFTCADAATRQRFIDVVKLAEGRGVDGTVMEAAVKELRSLGVLSQEDDSGHDPGRQQRVFEKVRQVASKSAQKARKARPKKVDNRIA